MPGTSFSGRLMLKNNILLTRNPADRVHSIMTQQTKGKKTGPGNKDKVHSEAEQVGGFLRSLGYQRKLDQSSYGSVLDVLKTIFDASGQQHLVHLVKLRKCWNKEIGGFLARHAMPSRISVEENFNLDRQKTKKKYSISFVGL